MSISTNDADYVYLDWAAATPLLPVAYEAMLPWLTTNWGNPSAIHDAGQKARTAIENARAQVARTLETRPEFITWTSNGTASNNLALMGTIQALHQAGRSYQSMEVVTTQIEHPSVTNTLAALQARGVKVRYVAVDESGQVDIDQLEALLSEQTVLVSVTYVNSEIGSIQSLRPIKKILSDKSVTLHLDAAQAPLWLSCQFDTLGADLVTFDAGKFCGPQGVGLLVRRRRVELTSVTHGGEQEQGLNPGTENVAGIVGAATALAWAQAGWHDRAAQVAAVRDAGIANLLKTVPTAVLNTPPNPSRRVANNINISIPNLDTEFATIVLDQHGFAVSTKSACSGSGSGASAVVLATTGDVVRATSTLRLTIGPDTTVDQLNHLAQVLADQVTLMERYSG